MEHNAGMVIDCDPQQLAQAILKMLDDPELRKTFQQNGYRFVENELDVRKTTRQMLDAYQQAIDQNLALRTG